ncbi:MAG TPA: hypothetical protein VFB74_29135 [Kribbellaceae bacterium]|nr:hypothetical protein [Kribbellaceae bacterium]
MAVPSAAFANSADNAVAWAAARIGQMDYYLRCLPFVRDAYLSTGVEIGTGYGNPVEYWNGHSTGRHTDTTPPIGALVFWGATATNADGHVAISEGGGSVISSYERTTSVIHRFAIADRNAGGYPYLGWMMPPGVAAGIGTIGKGGGFASSWSHSRLDVWTRMPAPVNGSNLGHRWFQDTWQPWEVIALPAAQLMTSEPAVVSWGVGRIEVFARGQASDLIHAWLADGVWHGWESFGGCVLGAPTATSWETGRLDVLVRGCDVINGTNLVHKWLPPGGPWQPWELIPATQAMDSSPAVVSWGANRLDFFARGGSGDLLHGWYASDGWHAWEALGGCIVGAPSASTWGVNRLDAWVQSCNSTGANIVHKFFDGNGWHPYELAPPSGVRVAGTPAAVSWSEGRIDVFARGEGGDLLHWWLDGSWGGPESLGGTGVYL